MTDRVYSFCFNMIDLYVKESKSGNRLKIVFEWEYSNALRKRISQYIGRTLKVLLDEFGMQGFPRWISDIFEITEYREEKESNKLVLVLEQDYKKEKKKQLERLLHKECKVIMKIENTDLVE